MKKGKVLLGIVSALLLLFHLQAIKAAGSYEITGYNATADILEDGSIELTQKITYAFDGDFNGVYYDQNLTKIKQLSDVFVAVTQAGQTTTLKEATTGANNTYQLLQEADKLRIKVFHKVSDEDVTLTYRYKLTGLITNYRDTAELNWKILGAGWDEPVQNIKVTLNLPTRPQNELQAWTHGPLTGYTAVDKKQGKVTLTLAELPTDQFLETHLLFPTAVTAKNPQFVDKDAKQSIQRSEAALAKAANEKRKAEKKQEQMIKNGFLGVILLASGGMLFLLWRDPGKKKLKFPPVTHSYEVPRYTPLEAWAIVKDQTPDSQAFSAYLLELAGKKRLTLEKLPGKKKKTENYLITLKDQTLLDQELFNFLFTKVGTGTAFTLEELKRYGKRNRQAKQLSKSFDQWSETNFKKARALGYYDAQSTGWLWTIGIAGALDIFALMLIVFFVTGIWCYLCFGLAGGVLVLSWRYLTTHARYTETGQEALYELKCFKKMLSDIGRFDLKKVGDLVLWEQILPYAVIFGLAKKVIRALQVEFGEAELREVFGPYYFVYFSDDFDHSFASSFSNTMTNATSYSSASGGSGGFSGGSSGGGGGGTGGAF